MFEYNNETLTLDELKDVAELKNVEFDSFYNEGLGDGSIVEKTNDVAETGAPATSKTPASASGDSPLDDTSSESVGNEQVVPKTFPIEEVTIKPRIMSFEDFRKVPLPTFPTRLEKQQGDKLSN